MKKGLLLALVLIIALLQQAIAQNRAISGRVTDRANSQGLPGVTVLVKGTTIGVSTNEDGNYTINVPASATTLVFSSIGYIPVEQPISSSTINVALGADSKQLGEVVVTGALGIERNARELGYAATPIMSKEITQARPTNVVNGLTGKVAGLNVQTVNNGVSPNVRITLRGTRSITGENGALVVIDGVQTTQDILATLNPDDIAEITVLKGANAAALYGSQATNGALIVTTKKGGKGPQVTFSHTSQLESISFWPKLQNEFGPGSTEWDAEYTEYENQQYGPRFDGSIRPLGRETENGNIQNIAYEARPNERKNFFKTGYQMQNNVSFSAGNNDTKILVSAQNLKNHGIIPRDVFERNTFRVNASTQVKRLLIGANVSYSQNRTETTTGAIYDQLVNTSSLIPLTQYKDWRNNEFANPNGYYNEYYANPYYQLDNNRNKNRQDYLIGNTELGYKITDWLSLTHRLGITTINQSSKSTTDRFDYSAFTLGRPGNARANIAGGVTDLTSYTTRLNSDFIVNIIKEFGDFSVKAFLGNNIQQNRSRYLTASANALSVPGVFNISSNRVGELTGGEGSFIYRQFAFYADATFGYKNLLFLHGSARQESVSILEKNNRSYFYPGVDASLVFTEAIPMLKDVAFLDYGKIRAGYAKTGTVNLPSSTIGAAASYGAYSLFPVYGAGSGFPFGSLASNTLSDRITQLNLQPEFTHSFEAGTEVSFFKNRIGFAGSYYYQRSINQAVQAGISPASGFGAYLLNAGEVQNNGVELELNLTPVETANGFTWRVGGNYNYNNNKVLKVTDTVDELLISSSGNGSTYAIKNQPFPVLRGTDYVRDDEGRVVLSYVDFGSGHTGYFPTQASALTTFGNTLPKHFFGFNTSLSYKGLTLAAQADYRTGYVIYNGIGSTLDFTGASARSAEYGRQPFVFPNSVTLDQEGNSVPNTTLLTPGGAEFWASSSYNYNIAANYVTKGDFFKLREVSLSYTLPASILDNARFIKGVTLNLYGRNLFLWVPKENKYTDPEFSFTSGNGVGINNIGQTPPTRFYGATLSATF
ncbi:SusC/RagA family TonB-linked outer membrane protein [Hymenobacter sp. NBH84]|uniref:SusC/RagA family TonB-linked outer membrane protein n=1 Tax=Hymenobacter sp. NBH84 TaxID=2596915 RepID=UPI0016289D76|nr:SusC/RagA family TonB-linked outer membrane protein [Hymenobacter sp. NBH84]QNE40381.1 SusC/RagA family TonB-linked outer membrane protein [Hymenobacter sp. NBH84]